MSGLLGLSPEDFRVLGLALAAFGRGDSEDPAEEDDRERAAGLHEILTQQGFLPVSTETAARADRAAA